MLPVRQIFIMTVLKCIVLSNSSTLGESREFSPAEIWDHGWLVEVSIERTIYNRKSTYHCLGALIHKRTVLTGGMCLNRTSPLSAGTDFNVYGESLDDSRLSTKQNIYTMWNVTYHNFEELYDPRKFDYGLVILFDDVFYDRMYKQSKLIPVANQSNFNDIDFNDCLLTSITTYRNTKHQLEVMCRMTSNILDCKAKNNDSVLFDSGSPVICKHFREYMLVGFISHYTRVLIEGGHKMLPLFTSIVPIGEHLTYNVIDNIIRKQYCLRRRYYDSVTSKIIVERCNNTLIT